jgi:hypothetical protein
MQAALRQRFDVQSLFLPQGLPIMHRGAQAGGAQKPAVHTSEPQSLFAPQRAPSVHLVAVAAHAGGSHVLVGPHTLEAHWAPVVQP